MMKFLMSLALLTPLLVASGAQAAALKIVEMKSLSYEPKKLEIQIGDSVEWKNIALTPHTATANDGKSFDTKTIAPKQTSKPVKFETAGTFDYHCTVHGKVMSATVVVTK